MIRSTPRGSATKRAVLSLRLLCLGAATASALSCTALPPPQEWFRREGERQAQFVSPAASVSAAALEKEIEKLTWEEALRLARDNSPTVAIAVERIGRAEARLREAQSLAYPRLDARGNYVRFIEAATFRGRTSSDVSGVDTRSRFFTDRGSDIYTGGLDFAYPLFDGGGAYYAREARAASLEASQHDRESILSALELQVSTAFLNVLLTEGQTRIAEEALHFSLEEERQARAREEVGEGLKVDRLRFSTKASEERLALNRVRAERRIQIAVLSELVGLAIGEDVEFLEPETGLELPEGGLVARALEKRPEIRSLRAKLSAAEKDLLREQATWWPSMNVFASYGFVSLDDLKLDRDEEELTVGGGLSWNLFEGGGTEARTAALRHDVEALRMQERELALRIQREVREAEIDLQVARENMAVSQETVTLAEEVLERISALYAEGEAQLLDVTEAQLQRTRAQLAYLRSRVNVLLSQARLRRAIGMGLKRNGE